VVTTAIASTTAVAMEVTTAVVTAVVVTAIVSTAIVAVAVAIASTATKLFVQMSVAKLLVLGKVFVFAPSRRAG